MRNRKNHHYLHKSSYADMHKPAVFWNYFLYKSTTISAFFGSRNPVFTIWRFISAVWKLQLHCGMIRISCISDAALWPESWASNTSWRCKKLLHYPAKWILPFLFRQSILLTSLFSSETLWKVTPIFPTKLSLLFTRGAFQVLRQKLRLIWEKLRKTWITPTSALREWENRV